MVLLGVIFVVLVNGNEVNSHLQLLNCNTWETLTNTLYLIKTKKKMKSKITIEAQEQNFHTGTLLPVIQIKQVNSDDVRDKLIRQFLNVLKGESQWCFINCASDWVGETKSGSNWTITPISPEYLESHLQIIKTTIERINKK